MKQSPSSQEDNLDFFLKICVIITYSKGRVREEQRKGEIFYPQFTVHSPDTCSSKGWVRKSQELRLPAGLLCWRQWSKKLTVIQPLSTASQVVSTRSWIESRGPEARTSWNQAAASRTVPQCPQQQNTFCNSLALVKFPYYSIHPSLMQWLLVLQHNCAPVTTIAPQNIKDFFF